MPVGNIIKRRATLASRKEYFMTIEKNGQEIKNGTMNNSIKNTI